ncbi:MAG: pitrilysin family protein [Patescibacteria group bacterium]|nr:pitrilysin family protein [Patescibacteria group bacterium]
MMFSKNILKNGLRVVTVPMQNTKTVTVLVVVETGSKYETKKNNGISHVLEHMFFKGTQRRPNTQILASEIDKIGGEHNAFTSEEFTGYYAKAASRHARLLFDLISDMFLNSKLAEQELSLEKNVICEEINMYQDIPMHYVGYLWEQLLYGDQPAGWLTIGTKENVQGFSREDLVNYLKKSYVAANTIIIVAGDIDSQKALTEANNFFGSTRVAPKPRKVKVLEKQNEPRILLQTKKTDQSHFCLGVRGYSVHHPDYYPLEVLTAVLGGGMSSRLFIAVRERRGLAYYVHTNFESYTDHGYLVTQAGVDNNNTEEAVKVVLSELRKAREQKVQEKELNKAKEYLKGKLTLDLETSDEYAFWLAGQEVVRGEMLTEEQIFQKIDAVSSVDAQRVANDIFRNNKLNLAVIGPQKEKEGLKQVLNL